jgi:amino acid transporter
VARGIVGPVAIATVLVSVIAGMKPVNVLSYYGSIATYGFIVGYLVISLAAAAYLRRLGELRPIHLVPSVLGALAMGVVLYYSLYPVPPYPFNVFPYVFVGLLVPGMIWYFLLRSRHPEVTAAAGSLSEGLHTN